MARWSLDYYAMEETRHKLRVADLRPVEPARKKVRRLGDVFEQPRSDMPQRAFAALSTQVTEAVAATQLEAEATRRQMGLLGALATAGIAALAYDRHAKRELETLDSLADHLNQIASGTPNKRDLVVLAQELHGWTQRAREVHGLLSNVASDEGRTMRARFRARSVLEDVATTCAYSSHLERRSEHQVSAPLCGSHWHAGRVDGGLPERAFKCKRCGCRGQDAGDRSELLG